MAQNYILHVKIASQGTTALIYDIKQRKKIELISVKSGTMPMKVGTFEENQTPGLSFKGELNSI